MVGRVLPRVQMMLKNGVGTRQISFALMGFFPAPPTARILRQKQPACKLLGKYFWLILENISHYKPTLYLLEERQIQKLLDLSWNVKEA